MYPNLNTETTPSEITSEVLRFCRSIDPDQTPAFVSVQPVGGALEGDCFFNVMEHVEANGGQVRFGWIIWEMASVYLTAEFHAVWERQDGTLVDITPQGDEERQVLFLPDSERVWEGRPVLPRYAAIAKNTPVRKHIRLSRRMWTLLLTTVVGPPVRGERPWDEARLSAADAMQLYKILTELKELRPKLLRLWKRPT